MSYDQKLQTAKEIITNYNNANPDSSIDYEKFEKQLKTNGGTSEDALRQCSWEDLESFGCKARLIARQIAQVFRTAESTVTTVVTSARAERMTDEELIERYNPTDATNPVGKRLKDISKGKKFIIFKDNGTIDVENSLKVLTNVKMGYPEVEFLFVNEVPTPIYRIGDTLDVYANENPLYPNNPLMADNTCHKTGIDWSGVAEDVKQMLNIGVTTGILKINSTADAWEYFEQISDFKKFRKIHSALSLKFDQLKKDGKLPSLRVSLKNTSKRQDPFFADSNHRTY